MTASTATARQIADEYVRAWLRGDAETALSHIAEDVVCESPVGRITGLADYRRFLEPFATTLVSGELIDVLGDDVRAATVYVVETPVVRDFRGMEYLTVDNGRITHVISVFDRSPMIKS